MLGKEDPRAGIKNRELDAHGWTLLQWFESFMHRKDRAVLAARGCQGAPGLSSTDNCLRIW